MAARRLSWSVAPRWPVDGADAQSLPLLRNPGRSGAPIPQHLIESAPIRLPCLVAVLLEPVEDGERTFHAQHVNGRAPPHSLDARHGLTADKAVPVGGVVEFRDCI